MGFKDCYFDDRTYLSNFYRLLSMVRDIGQGHKKPEITVVRSKGRKIIPIAIAAVRVPKRMTELIPQPGKGKHFTHMTVVIHCAPKHDTATPTIGPGHAAPYWKPNPNIRSPACMRHDDI